MNPRILLSLACAAAILIGLTLWLHIDTPGKTTVDVEMHPESESAALTSDGLNAPASTPAAVGTRAPVADVNPSAEPQPVEKIVHTGFHRSLSGTVTSSKDGKPIAFATIEALPPLTSLGASPPILYGTNGFGQYAIPDPDPGHWKLTCSARGYTSVERVITVDHLDPLQADFVLAPVTKQPQLLVRLRTPAGQPLLSAIDATCLEVAKSLRPVVVAQCPARRSDLPVGTSVLPIRATAVTRPVSDEWFEVALASKSGACCCLMLGNRVLDVAAFDENTESVALVASRDDLLGWLGSVRLTVLDDVSGEPITAIVEARPETGETRRADTDARGWVQVDRLMQGDIVVHVFASLRAPVTRKVTVRGGESVDLGVVRMVKTVEIAGWVETAQGDFVPPNVYAYRIDGEATLIGDLSTKPEASGAFTIMGAAPGQYLLSITGGTRPSLEAVQQGKVMGWAYVDARFGSVNGARIR